MIHTGGGRRSPELVLVFLLSLEPELFRLPPGRQRRRIRQAGEETDRACAEHGDAVEVEGLLQEKLDDVLADGSHFGWRLERLLGAWSVGCWLLLGGCWLIGLGQVEVVVVFEA